MTVLQAKAILSALRADQPDTTGDANIRVALGFSGCLGSKVRPRRLRGVI